MTARPAARRRVKAPIPATHANGSLPQAAPEAAADDTELLQACREFFAAECLVRLWNVDRISEAAGEAANARWRTLLGQITTTPAQTADGARAKVQAALIAMQSAGVGESDDPVAAAAMAALGDVLGRAAA
ncbi:MAG: hypothetical protein BGO51_13640 [Rhodospirillales bacterium 69-11]|nr:hypothetical protein [Rhodospirillales bacterium]OJW26375.1 MAG: hypothetical protein BGO51_13640 [Rhodospirillales bacterium 69-11]